MVGLWGFWVVVLLGYKFCFNSSDKLGDVRYVQVLRDAVIGCIRYGIVGLGGDWFIDLGVNSLSFVYRVSAVGLYAFNSTEKPKLLGFMGLWQNSNMMRLN